MTTQWIGKDEPAPRPHPVDTPMFPVKPDPLSSETPERTAISVLDEWRIKSAARPLPGDKPREPT